MQTADAYGVEVPAFRSAHNDAVGLYKPNNIAKACILTMNERRLEKIVIYTPHIRN